MPLVLAPLLIGFGVVVTFLLLYGLANASQVITGSSAEREQGGLRGWLNYMTHGGPIASVAGLANKAFRSTVSHWAAAHLAPVAGFFTALGTLYLHTYARLGDLAEATERAIFHSNTVVAPRAAKRAAAPARSQARAAHRAASHANAHAGAAEAEAERLFGKARAGIDRLTRDVTRTLPRAIGRVRSRVGALEREIPSQLRSRLAALEKATAFGALAAVVLRVLARKFPWLFCRNVQTTGRAVCGMDADLLGALLQDALLVGGTFSLVEMVRELEPLLAESVEAIASFWQAR